MAAVQIQISPRERHERTEMSIEGEDVKLLTDLIRLYLSKDFDPFAKDVGREEADATAETGFEFKYYTEKIGKILAQSGDDFKDEKLKAQLQVNQTLLRSLFDNVQNKDEVWKGFKEIMENSMKSNGLTGSSDPIKALQSCLLTVHGLKTLGKGVKELAQAFTQKFIEEKQLDKDMERIGGLKNYLESQID